MHKRILVLFMLFLVPACVLAQTEEYKGPDDPAGDIAAEREGYMTGNRVYLYFQNTTELSNWVSGAISSQWSRWPNNYDGTGTLDGIGLLVGARVYIENDTIPVDTWEAIQAKDNLDTLYYCQTSYRQHMDEDPLGKVEWGFYPVYGYFNENSEYPAMSNDSTSWPTAGWPAAGNTLKWPGEWDGMFGRGITYAQLETYFVVNDAHDQEYLGFEDRVKYYPRPGVHIGDKRPSVSIQKGKPWGGLGIRVEQRGLQWNNPQARDAIFWEYSIANISDYNLPEVAFGYWVDTWIGGENASDDVGYFDAFIDMAYCWDRDGIGFGGRPTGTLGFAYLESPGVPRDNQDNDQDGLVDEMRNNPATTFIEDPAGGIDNLADFLEFYKLTEDELKPHWDADEDQDWQDGVDLNGNGAYATLGGDGNWIPDPGENPGDDVGLDGVAPGDLNYFGPDEGECNHKPDFKVGIGCEPNFNETDVSESDMIGLTSFRLFNIPNENACYHWFCGDKSMWDLIGTEALVEWSGNTSNLILTFASGVFPLKRSEQEHISMSELHSYDPLAGLESSDHNAPALFEQKRIVQAIYEKDYRFVQPPKMPTLSATAGDGKVILTWDNVSDTQTRDPFIGNVNDFEGYKLYRATDKKFSDPEIMITDGYGAPNSIMPIFQCDKIDTISGFAEFGHNNGVLYNLGNETGIVHHYVDSLVENGRTYYYALVAYDYGVESLGISPSENTVILWLDEDENVSYYDKNVQIVTPHQKAAGYVPPSIEIVQDDIRLGDGTVTPEILSDKDLQNDHIYKVKFDVYPALKINNYDHGMLYTTIGFFVYDVTDSNTLVYQETYEAKNGQNILFDEDNNYYFLNTSKEVVSDVFEGLRLKINLPVITASYDYDNSDWIQGSAPLNVTLTQESYYFPWEYNVIFTGDPSGYTGQTTRIRSLKDENGAKVDDILFGQKFSFYVINKSFSDSSGAYEKMDMVVQDVNKNGQFDYLLDRVFVGPLNNAGGWAGTAFILDFYGAADESELPQPDDVYQITYNRPFYKTDSLLFKVKPEGELDKNKLSDNFDKIKVVPNPYIATNTMETAVGNIYLNQRRRIMFTNIPAQCDIKIFTISGILVDEINVNNPSDEGIVYWDLRSKEGLDVAAGMYFYHIKAKATSDEKMGKFAIIK